MVYRLTRSAAADLRHIFAEGTDRFGLAQAERYHVRLKQAFGLIADNPRMARERPELSPPARVHPCSAHVIIYILDPSDNVVIVRVRHAREDWAERP